MDGSVVSFDLESSRHFWRTFSSSRETKAAGRELRRMMMMMEIGREADGSDLISTAFSEATLWWSVEPR